MKVFTASVLGLLLAVPAFAQSFTDTWTFETSQPITAGPIAPEIGTGAATIYHASASTYSTPAGNGSAHAYSSNAWSVGDYYQFETSVPSIPEWAGATISWDQTSSSTGPKTFDLQYSFDGSTWGDLGNYAVQVNGSPNPAWNGTTSSSLYTISGNYFAGQQGESNLYIRLIDASTSAENGGTVASTGTDRVDNFTISVVPEPSTYAAVLGACSLALCFVRSKRKQVAS